MNLAHSYIVDAETLLEDAAAAITTSRAGQVGGADRILDFGNPPTPTAPTAEQIPLTRGTLVVDVRSLDFTTGDETYDLIYQLSDTEDFTGVVINRAELRMGASLPGSADDDSALGRVTLGVDNAFKDTLLRYARLLVEVGGTSPGLAVFAFFSDSSRA